MGPGGDYPRDAITGLILAGGRATRMGRVDKGLTPVNGRAMAAHVVDALRPQVSGLLINANRNLDAYAALGCPVVTDGDEDFRGPLAGMASGLAAARTVWLLTAPCDSPMVAGDLAARLYRAATDAGCPLAAAHDGQRLQPVFALIRRELAADLAAYLADGGRKIDRWYERCGLAVADFSDAADTFANINAPADLAALERRLAAGVDRQTGER